MADNRKHNSSQAALRIERNAKKAALRAYAVDGHAVVNRIAMKAKPFIKAHSSHKTQWGHHVKQSEFRRAYYQSIRPQPIESKTKTKTIISGYVPKI